MSITTLLATASFFADEDPKSFHQTTNSPIRTTDVTNHAGHLH